MELSAEKIIKNYKAMKSSRQDFDSLYQTLHDYYYVESTNITDKKNKGAEINTLLDATSLDTADVLASGLSNYLTPESSKWLYLEHPNIQIKDDSEVKAWMQEVAEICLFTLSGSNFYNQMPIFYKSSGVYGTSALFCEYDNEDGVRFYNIPIEKVYISDDAKEKLSEVYIKFEYTAEQAISKFGDKVSDSIKEAQKSGKDDEKKFIFICNVGKRREYDETKRDKANMPFRMAWVEEEERILVKEDGFQTMPVVVHRFYKRPSNPYGYSPAMKALPYVRLVNTIVDTTLRAAMKATSPAYALPDDVFLGTPDFNPEVLNYYQRGSLDPAKEIFPIGNSGNPNIGLTEIEYYQNQIKSLMFYDTFQAFSTLTKQMTVPEVMERISEKMTLLGPAVGRYMSDVLQPVIEKLVYILFENNKLPPLPQAMIEQPDFDVKFVGRLVQSQRQSEINNLVEAMSIAGQVAAFKPEVLDKINGDEIINDIFNIKGVNVKSLYSDDEVNSIRESRAAQMQQQMQMEQGQGMADIYKTATEGGKNAEQASK